ncbi:MAG: hypothetical protein ACTJE5_08800, partial [Pseudomonas helleri]|uniref:hypothetical protein n=1 Tax=Pseudomonas helleri TaxID=1608996 RepID=UPI003F958298
MNEQIHSLKAIDHEYSARFNLLLADTQREWEAAKQAAKENQDLTPAEALCSGQLIPDTVLSFSSALA